MTDFKTVSHCVGAGVQRVSAGALLQRGVPGSSMATAQGHMLQIQDTEQVIKYAPVRIKSCM